MPQAWRKGSRQGTRHRFLFPDTFSSRPFLVKCRTGIRRMSKTNGFDLSERFLLAQSLRVLRCIRSQSWCFQSLCPDARLRFSEDTLRPNKFDGKSSQRIFIWLVRSWRRAQKVICLLWVPWKCTPWSLSKGPNRFWQCWGGLTYSEFEFHAKSA